MTKPIAVMELSRRMQDSHCLDPYHILLKKTPSSNNSAYFLGAAGGTVEVLACVSSLPGKGIKPPFLLLHVSVFLLGIGAQRTKILAAEGASLGSQFPSLKKTQGPSVVYFSILAAPENYLKSS